MEPGIRASPDFPGVLACDDRAVNPTVLIVDDHAGFRSWTRSLLEAEGLDWRRRSTGLRPLLRTDHASVSGAGRRRRANLAANLVSIWSTIVDDGLYDAPTLIISERCKLVERLSPER